MVDEGKRVIFLCERCGSKRVMIDAWAEWNVEEQEWVLGATYDHTYCHKCDGETHAIEVELAPVHP